MIDVEKLIAKMPFDEACDMAIDASGGPDAFRPYLPFGADLDVLAVKYAQDKNFNQGDMAAPYLTVWDRAAGFQVDERPIQPPTYRYAGGGPHRLLQSNGVKPLTLSLTVVLLNRAAYRLLLDAGLAPPPPDKAVVIQPYPGILMGNGDMPDMRRRLDMLRGVDPGTLYVLVPLAIGLPGGLSARQAGFLPKLLSDPSRPSIVSQFYERLGLDSDVRPWIDRFLVEVSADGQ